MKPQPKDRRPQAAQAAEPQAGSAKVKVDRIDDVMEEFLERVKKLDAELQASDGRYADTDERVGLMEELCGRTLQLSEVYKVARKIRVVIHKSEKKDAVDPVPITVNGYCITVKRGETVEIAEHFLGALELAVESHFNFATDKNDPSILNADERQAPSYPYSVNPRATTRRGEVAS